MRKDGPPIRFVAIGLVLSAGMLLGQYELLVRPDNSAGLADAENPVMTVQLASSRSRPSGQNPRSLRWRLRASRPDEV
jgi:hypothetical protein